MWFEFNGLPYDHSSIPHFPTLDGIDLIIPTSNHHSPITFIKSWDSDKDRDAFYLVFDYYVCALVIQYQNLLVFQPQDQAVQHKYRAIMGTKGMSSQDKEKPGLHRLPYQEMASSSSEVFFKVSIHVITVCWIGGISAFWTAKKLLRCDPPLSGKREGVIVLGGGNDNMCLILPVEVHLLPSNLALMKIVIHHYPCTHCSSERPEIVYGTNKEVRDRLFTLVDFEQS